MKRLLFIGVSAAFFASAALAQTVVLEPQHRTVIRSYVTSHTVRPAPIRERVSVGWTVPADVELAPVPEEIYAEIPVTRSYRYFTWEDRFVLVDPGTRRVIEIID
jgi:Protein of unknown function (DUF1236)